MARSGRVTSSEEGAASAAPTPVTRRSSSGQKVRVTAGGGKNTYEFKGRTFSRDGEVFDTGELGWTTSDAADAAADPHLIIESVEGE